MTVTLGQPITQARGTGVVVPGDDIDTDRIIPARFMKCVTFDGLGQYAFHDERFDADGSSKGHPLDDPRFAGASVLLSGRSFGSGSSREHAPQALARFGIRAVLARSFAEIFHGNAITLGIVCATVDAPTAQALADGIQVDPSAELVIDVAQQVVRIGSSTWPVSLDAKSRDALLSGRWDPLQTLRENADEVAATAAALPYASWTGLSA